MIVIDGLDECDDQAAQQDILTSISRSIYEGALPIRILIASRPEPHISEIFRRSPLKKLHCSFNTRQSFVDVKKYLLHEFTRIHAEHHETMVTVSSPWPLSEVIDMLVEKSSGYFVFVPTVIRFIDDKNFRPTERLAMIMGFIEPDFEFPFAGVDELYIQILSRVPRRPRVLQILTAMSERFGLQVNHIEQHFGLLAGDVRLTPRELHSLINIPEEDTVLLTAHHASLYDFLRDSTRSGSFYIGTSQHRTNLAVHVAMAYSYMNDNPNLTAADMFLSNYPFRRKTVQFDKPNVFRQLGRPGFQYITSIEPSADLVVPFQSFNPDFLLSSNNVEDFGAQPEPVQSKAPHLSLA